jgi:hypothetical protein
MDLNIINFEYILESNDPDKEFEYFWLSLKKIINNQSNNTLINQIKIISDILNCHKVKNEYKMIFYKINDFLKKYISEIISTMLDKYIETSKNIIYINEILDIINRWKKISPNFNLDLMEINLLKYIKMINDNRSEIVIEIYNCMKNYDYITLLNYAINNDNVFLVDILKQHNKTRF